MITTRDKHLRTVDLVSPVRLFYGFGTQGSNITTGSGFGQAHSAAKFSGIHFLHVLFSLFLGTKFLNQGPRSAG